MRCGYQRYMNWLQCCLVYVQCLSFLWASFNFWKLYDRRYYQTFPLFAIQVLRWKGNILTAPCILNIGSSWRGVVGFTPQLSIFRRKVSRYPLHRRLDGAQGRGGRIIEHYLASTGNQTTIPYSHNVVTYLFTY